MYLTKKSIRLERLLCKDKNAIRGITCNKVLITLVNLCNKRASVCQSCNGPDKNNGLPFPLSYDLVAATKMRR